MLNAQQRESLSALLGPKGFLLPEDHDLAAYETCVRYGQGKAAFVLRPETSQQLSRAIALCHEAAVTLIPQSGNTGLVGASVPDQSGVQGVLSLDHLKGEIAFDPDNRSVTVGAGVRLSELNACLEPLGFSFPIDLGADPAVGGMLATNTGGARFLRYGDVRQNTLGLEVVLYDEQGTQLNFMKGLRKDNTGVDWKQLFIGTGGAFGVITRAVLNVEPLARDQAAALIVPRDDKAVSEILLALESRCGPLLTAFEGMSREAMLCAYDHVPSLRNPFAGGDVPEMALLVELSQSWETMEGEQPLSGRLETVLGDIWSFESEPLVDALVGSVHDMWSLRHALSEGVKHAGQIVPFDVSFTRRELMTFRSAMAEELPREFPGVRICDFGHIGDGGLHFNLVIPQDHQGYRDSSFVERLRAWVIVQVVERFNGSFSAEHAVGRSNQAFYDRYTPQKLKQMSEELKKMTSPDPLGAVTLS
ncbi:FAD-binding oxidoreductase [Kiloniella sp. b19]|uniref:FAD-binding oxidoreductase n=1 Tax=Kiloniella sp. GXU_MW_B19 TaxID=3141326 RepID=UPI0031D902EE